MVSFRANNQTWHFINFQTGERANLNTLRLADTDGDLRITDAERDAAKLVASNGEGDVFGFNGVGLDHIDLSPQASRGLTGNIGYTPEGSLSSFYDVGDFVYSDQSRSDILDTGPNPAGANPTGFDTSTIDNLPVTAIGGLAVEDIFEPDLES